MNKQLQLASKIFLTFVMLLAGIGLVTCLTVSVLSLLGIWMASGIFTGKFMSPFSSFG